MDQISEITLICDLLSYIEVAYQSSDLEHLLAKEKKEKRKRKKLLLKNRIPPFTLRVGGCITSVFVCVGCHWLDVFMFADLS